MKLGISLAQCLRGLRNCPQRCEPNFSHVTKIRLVDRSVFPGFALGLWVSMSPLLSPAADTNCALAIAEPGEELSGGATTVVDTSPKAFGFPAANLREEHRAAFFVG